MLSWMGAAKAMVRTMRVGMWIRIMRRRRRIRCGREGVDGGLKMRRGSTINKRSNGIIIKKYGW